MAGSEFAKRLLKKQGWKEGSGLGKQEHGRTDPIKVTLKMDKSGVGHDPGKEFTDHWWLRVFNEAAQKIGKKKQIEVNGAESEKKADARNSLYKGFVKSSTLTNGVEESNKDSESSEDESDIKLDTRLPTLDDIHKFCGGATGHRAAMFGIKMKGKLSRVAEQDSHFEKKIKEHKLSSDDKKIVQSKSEDNHPEVKQKRKRKNSSTTTDLQCFESQEEVSNGLKKKKKRKQKEKDKEDCSGNIESINTIDRERSVKKKKKKHKKGDNLSEETNSEECISKKKKKKRKTEV